jgi:hypothetical protein
MAKKSAGAKLTFYMTLAVLLGFATILAMNAVAFLGIIPSKHISPNDVRGMAVQHHDQLYTLNFDQQKTFIDILNRSFPVGKELVEKRKVDLKNPPEVQKIIIYRFNAPDLEITPVGYVSKTTSVMDTPDNTHGYMVFSVPEWNQNGLLEESTSDELLKLLPSTYSP